MWHSHRGRLVPGLLLATLFSLPLFAQVQTGGKPDHDVRWIALELYVRSDDPSSDRTQSALLKYLATRSGVTSRTIDLDTNPAAAKRLDTICKHLGIKNPKLPAIYGCRRLIQATDRLDTLKSQLRDMLKIHVYVRSGCPRCARARVYLRKLDHKYPGFEIELHDIVSDWRNRNRLQQLASHYRVGATSVPAFHLCNRLVVGFGTESTTGKRIEAILDHWTYSQPKRQRDRTGVATPAGTSVAAVGRPNVLAMVIQRDAIELPTSPSVQDTANPEVLPLPLEPLPLPDPKLDSEPLPTPELPSGDDSYAHDESGFENSADSMDVPVLGRLSVSAIGLPLFTFAIGLVDGFNPCAMWVLLFLLSILVNLKDRKKILAIAGTFVLISGLAYYAFMAAWLSVFMFVGLLRSAQIVLGLFAVLVGAVNVKDFFALHKGISLSIPESAKPGIYRRVRSIVLAENLSAAVATASLLAVLVNVIELLCTAGLPALYTEILTLQRLPFWMNYMYLGLYILAYMLDDSIMVAIVVVTLQKRKMQERQGRWLKLVSGAAIMSLGLIMLLVPEWLI